MQLEQAGDATKLGVNKIQKMNAKPTIREFVVFWSFLSPLETMTQIIPLPFAHLNLDSVETKEKKL